jgi:ERF superfamily
MTETKLTLAQKLVKVYEEIDSVTKRGTNAAQNYKYVKAADLAHAVRNALQKLNVYAQVTFSDSRPWNFVTSSGKSQNAFDTTCTLTFIDADNPDGVRYTATGLGSGADFGDKGVFKAQTGALKYALRNAFLVPDETDPENDGGDKDENPQSEQRKAVEPKKAAGKTEKASAGAPPEKAQIPNDLTVASSATATSALAATSTPSENASAPSTASDANEVPNEEELKPFRKQYMALVKLLSENGLTSETGNPQKKKVLAYLLQTTGADAAENVTKGQWRTFLSVTASAAEQNVKGLVELVESAGKSN